MHDIHSQNHYGGICRLIGLHAHNIQNYIPVSHGGKLWAGISQRVERLAMGWTVWGSNPGVGVNVRILPDRAWGPHNLLYNGYCVIYGDKLKRIRP
jgi:hypothetical protein